MTWDEDNQHPQGQMTGEEKKPNLPEVKKPTRDPVHVGAKENGMLIGTNLDQQLRLAAWYAKSGMLPKHYDTPEKVITGMQYAYELGLKPLTAMRQISIVNGNPCLWGELPLGLVRRSGLLESISEYYLDATQTEISQKNKNLKNPIWAAVCEVKRKGDAGEVSKIFTVEDMKTARLHAKDVWQKHQAIMMKRRIRSVVLKDVFPDVLSGIEIAEYDHDMYFDNKVGDLTGSTDLRTKNVSSVNERLQSNESEPNQDTTN